MHSLKITPAARDFILSLNWDAAMRERGMKSNCFVPAIMWGLDPAEQNQPGLVLGPVLRSEIPEERFVSCQGETVDIAELLPEEILASSRLLDLADDRLILLRD